MDENVQGFLPPSFARAILERLSLQRLEADVTSVTRPPSGLVESEFRRLTYGVDEICVHVNQPNQHPSTDEV